DNLCVEGIYYKDGSIGFLESYTSKAPTSAPLCALEDTLVKSSSVHDIVIRGVYSNGLDSSVSQSSIDWSRANASIDTLEHAALSTCVDCPRIPWIDHQNVDALSSQSNAAYSPA